MANKKMYIFVIAIATIAAITPFLFKMRSKEVASIEKLPLRVFITYNLPQQQINRINKELFGKPDLNLKWVNVEVDGKRFRLSTDKEFVGDILKQADIKIVKGDEVRPSPWEIVKPNETIKISRIQEQTVTEIADIPFKVTKSYTDRLEQGKSVVVRDGQNGKKELIYKVILKDGKEIARTLLQEKVLKLPINKVIAVGTIGMLTTSRGEVIRYSKVLTMEATAYTSSYSDTGKSPGDGGYGITASGIRVKPGIAAVDPLIIPLGTRLYVEGYGYALAADTGSAIVGNRIDLYFSDSEKAQRYGRRIVKVYVLK